MINKFYNNIFWFLRTKRVIFFSKFNIPSNSVLVWDNFELCSKVNYQYFSSLSVVFHSEFIIVSNSIILLNSKKLNKSLLYTSLQPCFLCCVFFLKYKILNIYFFIPKKTFCYFANILYFFLKKNSLFSYFLNINLSFLNLVLLYFFFHIRR